MFNFSNYSYKEQNIIRKAYQFEKMAMIFGSEESNPYVEQIKEMKNWRVIWEAINDKIESIFN